MNEELRFERLINAGRDVVFELFTDHGGQVAFYQQDEPGWVVRSECDLRPGGLWKVDFGPSEQALYTHRHVFTAIEPPCQLLFTTSEIRPDGADFDSETEILFEEVGDQTLMTVIQRGLPTEELRLEHTVGLLDAFAHLEHFVAGVLQSRAHGQGT